MSSLNFSPLSFTITSRNLSGMLQSTVVVPDQARQDIGTILSVRKVTGPKEGVSWTSGEFDYFVHTVDRRCVAVVPRLS